MTRSDRRPAPGGKPGFLSASSTGPARSAWSLLAALVALAMLPALCGCSALPFGKGVKGKINERKVTGSLIPEGKPIRIWLVKPHDNNIELVAVERPAYGANALEGAVSELLKGPDAGEEAKGLASEIPRGTILLGIDISDDRAVINLSRRFTSGGGPTSMETRIDQLARTASELAGTRKVFLDVEGKRLTASSADGLEIKQPIN